MDVQWIFMDFHAFSELFLGEVVRSGAWRGDGRAPGARGDLKRMCARLSAGRRVRRDVLGLAPHHGVQRWPGEGLESAIESDRSARS